jgi:hypothetical protein
LVEYVHDDPSLRIATSRNLLVAEWTDAPTGDQMRVLEREGRKLGRLHRQTALINLMVRGTPSFSNEVRQEVVRLSRDGALMTLARAHVVLAEGMVGAAVRAFISTTLFLARVPIPTKVLGSLETAAAWLVEPLSRGTERWTEGDVLALMRIVVKR